MSKQDTIDETTENIRQSIIDTKAFKQKEKYCIRDFSGAIFDLTPDMLVRNNKENKDAEDIDGVAEQILRKYEKLLSVK